MRVKRMKKRLHSVNSVDHAFGVFALPFDQAAECVVDSTI